jgi:hypothetical protein
MTTPITGKFPLFIIAGNHDEFVEYCRANDLKPYSKEVRYASSPATVDGSYVGGVLRIGSWRSRKDLARLEEILARCAAKTPRRHLDTGAES